VIYDVPLTTKELADVLGVSLKTVYQAWRRGVPLLGVPVVWDARDEETSASKKKNALLARARAGEDRPGFRGERKLADLFRLYLKKGSKVYDPVFAEEVRRVRPDWLGTQRSAKKEAKTKLLEWATQGRQKPSRDSKDPLERRLQGVFRRSVYNTKWHEGEYDESFKKQLRRLRPDWFLVMR
jgi:hypothetical protein